ncbi:MAG: hypothetical protein LUD70_14975 [Bacteroides ovatus]|uniref:hypothetical protein n=1 Tax=Bacteroides sp. TaxID=29523 RepID=UPI003AB113E0|nr:hypothetical protein [Bacteroides ovatus]
MYASKLLFLQARGRLIAHRAVAWLRAAALVPPAATRFPAAALRQCFCRSGLSPIAFIGRSVFCAPCRLAG